MMIFNLLQQGSTCAVLEASSASGWYSTFAVRAVHPDSFERSWRAPSVAAKGTTVAH